MSNQTSEARGLKFNLRTLVASVLIAAITPTLLTGIYFVSFVRRDEVPSTIETSPSPPTSTIETDGAGNYWAVRYDGRNFGKVQTRVTRSIQRFRLEPAYSSKKGHLNYVTISH